MEDAVVTMTIVSFCFAAVVILKKDSIPDPARKPLALLSLVMVAASFVMLIFSFLRM